MGRGPPKGPITIFYELCLLMYVGTTDLVSNFKYEIHGKFDALSIIISETS